MNELLGFLREGAQGDLLPWTVHQAAAETFQQTPAQVEALALAEGLLPARYQRNRQIISVQDQARLFASTVAVLGCGGLGGYILEELVRLGVGTIVAVDPDVFEEHNLNRQVLSTTKTLGTAKVDAAVERLAQINPSVTVRALRQAIGSDNGEEILTGCDLAVDALDSISARLDVSRVCSRMKIPLVHGAIAGWYGHVVTQLPGEDTLERIYAAKDKDKGIETGLGNPSFTPAVVASLQVAEACKYLLKRGQSLSGTMLFVNLLDMEVEKISLGEAPPPESP